MANEEDLKAVWNDLPVYPQEERAELYERINCLTLNGVYHELERRLSNLPEECKTKGHRHLSLMAICEARIMLVGYYNWLPKNYTIKDIRELVEKGNSHSQEASKELEFLTSCLQRARIEHRVKL